MAIIGEGDHCQPLLPPSAGQVIVGEITTSPPQEMPTPPPKNQRLVSLDVFRGLTVGLMILVDDAGGVFPSINHSSWFEVTLPDFVMSFFLFGVGVFVSLVFKKVPNRVDATKKVRLRTIKLFVLGVLLQGGYFHGRHDLTYGVNVRKIRWLGMLQRPICVYRLNFESRNKSHWLMVALIVCAVYMCLMYGLFVPDWAFELQSVTPSDNCSYTQTVHCGVRGSLDPPCNAFGFVNRVLLGLEHMYQHPLYIRTEQCSVNSPDYGPLPPKAPYWCLAPFDPEGILSSLMASITSFIGLHFGHVLLHVKDNLQRLVLWVVASLSLVLVGYVLVLLRIPLSKPLYTLSYLCVIAGASGLLLGIMFFAVDVKEYRKATLVMKWMGMNALIVYSLAAYEIFPAVVQGFYLGSPENNLVDGTD